MFRIHSPVHMIYLQGAEEMSETAEIAGTTTVTLRDGRVFKEQGRLVLTRGRLLLSGAGFIRTSVDCPPGTVVEVQIREQSLQALITEVERLVSRYVVQVRRQEI